MKAIAMLSQGWSPRFGQKLRYSNRAVSAIHYTVEQPAEYVLALVHALSEIEKM